jgi:uridine kinase
MDIALHSAIYTIGIAGGTGSGKTTVARELAGAFPAGDVVYLAFDHYYRDLSVLPPHVRQTMNFDHPDSLEAELLVSHLTALKSGTAVDRPDYDFTTHSRLAGTVRVDPAPVIIVEGILTFAYPALRELLDMKVYVDTESDIRFIRRLQRDVKERGRILENVVAQYLTTVRPMHLEFVEPSKRFADIIIPEGRNDVAMQALVSTVKHQITATRAGQRSDL